MSREHKEVRLNRRTFSNEWEVVRLAKDGKTITDRWPLIDENQTLLNEIFGDGERDD